MSELSRNNHEQYYLDHSELHTWLRTVRALRDTVDVKAVIAEEAAESSPYVPSAKELLFGSRKRTAVTMAATTVALGACFVAGAWMSRIPPAADRTEWQVPSPAASDSASKDLPQVAETPMVGSSYDGDVVNQQRSAPSAGGLVENHPDNRTHGYDGSITSTAAPLTYGPTVPVPMPNGSETATPFPDPN